MVYLFFASTFIVFYFILLITYFIMKSSKAFLNLQQSAYDNKRFFRFIKSHYKTTFGVNELFPIIFLLIPFGTHWLFWSTLFMCAFWYYNLRFLNISNKRFLSKLKLNKTSRVKRQMAVFTILNIILFLFLVFNLNILAVMMLMIYLVYPLLFITNLILLPFENKIKEGYKKRAVAKISSYSNVEVIGITGSYGKTSIKNIVGSILGEYERTLITPESYNTPMGLTITINNFLEFYHENFIAEMGAYYTGEIKELCDMVNPKIGIVSSVGPQHLETFKSIDNICNTKMELIESLPSDGLGILNYDNKYIREYSIKNSVAIKYYSLLDKNADIFADNIVYNNGIMEFIVYFKGQEYKVSTRLLGRHNVENILAAVLVCDYKGIDSNNIIKAISKLKPIKNRLEYKYINKQLSILDDAFNSNVDGIKEAIEILNNFENKRRIIITPGLIDLGEITEEFHNELGQLMLDKCDDIFIVGRLNKEAILKHIANNQNVCCEDDFLTAYNKAINLPGEKVILIANDLPDKFNE